MSNIFSQKQRVAGGFRADKLRIQMGGIGTGLLVTSLDVNYQQPVRMIYALDQTVANTSDVYVVAGRPEGEANIGRVVGPGALATAWLHNFCDACNIQNNTMSVDIGAAGDCSASPGGKYTMSGCLIRRLGIRVESEQGIIQQQIGLGFIDLDDGQ